MKTRIIAIVALALAGCAHGTPAEPTDMKPDDPEAVGAEATEPPSAFWEADPGLAPPDDPALPF